MSLNNIGLGMIFTAQDLASGVMRSLRGEFSKTTEAGQALKTKVNAPMNELISGTVVMAKGLVGLKTSMVLTDAAGNFEYSIAQVAAVSGATAKELQQLEAAAIQAGIATQYSPVQAAVALGDLAQAGYNARESIELLNPVLNLAAGSLGQLSPSESAGLASQAMKAFGIETKNAGLAVDQMLQAVNVFALGANELPLALGTASRGALALNQSLEETLVALGLVKNVIPSVERASTATAVAMQRMADPDAQKALKALGISVADGGGKFRNFLDIVGDMIPKLDSMTEMQRAAWLQSTFGSEAIGGLQVIMKQMGTGIRDASGNVRKGADAISYLRDQFKNADGTAKKFSNTLLDTYVGQKTLLGGTLETLQIVVGKPFARVMRPIVEAITNAVNALIAVFQKLSPGTKDMIAKFVLVASSIMTVVGGVLALKAAAAAAGFSFAALGAFISGALSIALPLVAIGAALYGIWKAFGDQISLAAQALVQLFTDGGFSGDTRTKLMEDENQGVLNFVMTIGMWAARLSEFFTEFGSAVSSVFDSSMPAFDTFMETIRAIANEFEIVMAPAEEAGAIFDSFGKAGASAGKSFGEFLRGTLNVLMSVLTALVSVGAGVVKSFQIMHSLLPSLSSVFQPVIEAFDDLVAMFGTASNDGTTMREVFFEIGRFLGGWLASQIRLTISAIAILVRWVMKIAEVIGNVIRVVYFLLTGQWSKAWQAAGDVVISMWNAIVETIFGVVEAMASVIEVVATIFGKKLDIKNSIAEAKKFLQVRPAGAEAPVQTRELSSLVSTENVPAAATTKVVSTAAASGAVDTGKELAKSIAAVKMRHGDVYIDRDKIGQVMSVPDEADRGGYGALTPISR